MNSLFLFSSQADNVDSITASSSVLPVTNIQNTQRSKVWRSGIGTTSYIQFQLANPLGADYLALIDLNLTTAGTILIEAWDDAFDGAEQTVNVTVSPTLYAVTEEAEAFGGGNYGAGLFGANTPLEQLSSQNITLYDFGEAVFSPYWRITFTDENISYQQLGRLMLSSAFVFTYNLSLNYNLTRIDRSPARESMGGQRFVQKRPSRLQIGGKFPLMPDVDRTAFLIEYERTQNTDPFVYSIYPENTNKGLTTTLYGRFSDADMSERIYQATDLNFTVVEEL